MLKKYINILFLPIIIVLLNISISYGTDKNIIIKNKLVAIESKIYYKSQNLSKYCSDINNYYSKILKLVIKYKTKFPKYTNLLELIYDVAKERQKTNNIICKSILTNNDNSQLKGDYNLNYLIPLNLVNNITGYNKPLFKKANLDYTLPSLLKASENKDFYFKINNKWFIITSGYRYITLNNNEFNYFKNEYKNYLKDTNSDFAIYLNTEDKYKIIFIPKKYLLLTNFNPNGSFNENLKNINNNGGLFVDKIYFSISTGYFAGGLVEIDSSLFFLIPKNTYIKYIILDKTANLAKTLENYPLIVGYRGNYYGYNEKEFNFYYIGPTNIYKNILLEKLGKILYPSFYYINKSNYTYSINDMKNLLKFASKFDKHKLSYVWAYFLLYFKYEEKISNLVNKKVYLQKELNEYLQEHKELLGNWITFYSLKNHKGVCQSLSDLFSLVALFNGLNSDIVTGYVPAREYYHQISQINNLYYDPTYGLLSKDLNYFGMSLKKIERYFEIK